MITHVVMIRFRAGVTDEAIRAIEQRIAALAGRIPGLESMETGRNFSPEERAMDLVLIARLTTREALAGYAIHPEHLAVIDALKPLADYTKVVDYETDD